MKGGEYHLHFRFISSTFILQFIPSAFTLLFVLCTFFSFIFHLFSRIVSDVVIPNQLSMELQPDEQAEAETVFGNMIAYALSVESTKPYRKATLVDLAYTMSLEKRYFLDAFFRRLHIGPTTGARWTKPGSAASGMAQFVNFGTGSTELMKTKVKGAVDSFAEFLYEYLLEPMKANGLREPPDRTDPPRTRSLDGPHYYPIETEIVPNPRFNDFASDCLTRDRHRCLVSGFFDFRTAYARLVKYHDRARDDEGQILPDLNDLRACEATYILPPSLVSATDDNDGRIVCIESDR